MSTKTSLHYAPADKADRADGGVVENGIPPVDRADAIARAGERWVWYTAWRLPTGRWVARLWLLPAARAVGRTVAVACCRADHVGAVVTRPADAGHYGSVYVLDGL